jgi:hypothetical protein
MIEANVLPYTVLKIFAFQDRHENKDAYDLVFTLLNSSGGPRAVGRAAAASEIAQQAQASEALGTLRERFSDVGQDGPATYASFLATGDEEGQDARLRRQAVATIRAFLGGFRSSG